MTMPARILASIVVLRLLCPTADTQAQGAAHSPTGRIAVNVALVDQYRFSGSPAVILRHGAGQPDDIVMPASAAAAEDLVSAVITAELMMDQEGDVAPKKSVIRVLRLAAVPKSEVQTATSLLSKIRLEPERQLPGLGVGRADLIFVPDNATRAFQKAQGKFGISKP